MHKRKIIIAQLMEDKCYYLSILPIRNKLDYISLSNTGTNTQPKEEERVQYFIEINLGKAKEQNR